MKTNKLALILAKGLSLDGLTHYLSEQKRMILNEIHMGRSPRVFKIRENAAIQAIALKSGAL